MEGMHSRAFAIAKKICGAKTGKGKEEHEEAIRNFVVAIMNWGFQGKDPLDR